MTWNAALKRAIVVTLALLICLLPALAFSSLPSLYLREQDGPVAVIMLGAMIWLVWRTPTWRLPSRAPSSTLVLVLAGLSAGLLWLGTYVVLYDYPFTRDEHMAAFDAATFSSGVLAYRVPSLWAGFSTSLVPNFLLVTPNFQVLASAYLPVNAAMRAGFDVVGDPALMNPLLAAAGLVALYRVANRLFMDDAQAIWITVGGYLLSSQIALNAMTHYAMTAHLVFNLVWLALFLRGSIWAHGAAMLVGGLAIGLHQPIFHPLFAAPFLSWLLVRRQWRLSAVYAAVYAVALIFWFSWPSIVAASVGVTGPAEGSSAGAQGFLQERVLPLVSRLDAQMPALMAANLLRALMWNAAFVLPLMILAIAARKRLGPEAKCLLAGVILTLAAMAILLPFQGHGWGYRYIHGVLGSCLLLAGYGWRTLRNDERAAAQGAVIALAAITPIAGAFQMWRAHEFVGPHVAVYRLAASQQSDFVVIDTEPPSHAIDEVRNRADLTNRPLLFSSRDLTPGQLAVLCSRGKITLVSRHDLQSAGLALKLQAHDPAFQRRVAPLAGRGCLRPLIPRG